jgi:hypothetical protein
MPGRPDRASPRDFQLLGLEYGASPDQVKQAYKSFVKTWHPDRFPRGSHQQQRAQEKLKDVNTAYRRIRNCWAAPVFEARRESAEAAGPEEHKQQRGGPHTAGTRPPGPAFQVQEAFKRILSLFYGSLSKTSEQKRRTFRPWMLLLLILSLVIALIKIEPSYLPEKRTQPSPSRTAVSSLPVWPTSLPPVGPEQTPSSEAPRSTLPLPPQNRDEDIAPSEAEHLTGDRPFFTVGSSKAEVFRVQGKPAKVYGQKWVYGLSDVTFREGRVWRYHNFDGTLRVRMLPMASTEDRYDSEFFSLGSTKDEVLRAQGTPTMVEGNKWSYGFSEIYFKGGMVTGFNNFFNNLKVAMRPSKDSSAALTRGYFTVGSNQDEVLAIQGTPTIVQGNLWSYHLSDVLFADGKVRSVNDFSGILKYLP